MGLGQELVPLLRNEVQSSRVQRQVLQKAAAAADTLELPFVDDFAESSVFADSAKYLPGGVYVNNHFCVNPPTINVASFDGLKSDGEPYNLANQFSRGLCDTLASKPIHLLGKNNVKMSFWWQAQGNAVPQISEDSIQLMFKDNTGNWQMMWSQTGLAETNDFQFEIVDIDSVFLHDAFQFRFESYGNQSGMFGVWHIDYIFIDDNRTANDSVLNDVAFSNTPSSFLKKYWAMPIWQFFENPDAELRDSIHTSLNNFKNDGSGLSYVVETHGQVSDEVSGGQNIIHTNTTNLIGPYEKQKEVSGSNTSYSFIPSTSTFTKVKNEFKMVSNDQAVGDTVSGQVAEYSTNQNDSVCSFTHLADYYAYDDGTAEQAFRITQQDGIVVQKYTLNRPDTLYGVSVYFPNNAFEYDSTQIVWMIWRNAVGDYNADSIIYDERKLIGVADSLNGFTYYNFFDPVPLTGSFYIGYKQDDVHDILIGFDVNSDPGFEPIYFNTTGTWKRFQQVKGVLMLRPLFRPHAFTAVKEKFVYDAISVYPNPGNGRFQFSENVDEVSVFDLAGKIMKLQTGRSGAIDVSDLPKGIYLLKLTKQDHTITQRIIKQ